MLLSKNLLGDILARAVSTGADFAEVFAENTRTNSISYLDKKIEKIQDNVYSGVGIRAFLGTRTAYACTTDLSREGLLRCASDVADAIGTARIEKTVHLLGRILPNVHPVLCLPGDTQLQDRIAVLKRGCETAYAHDGCISQVSGTLLSVDRTFLIANTESLLTQDRKVRTRLAISAVASLKDEKQTGFFGPGAGMGMEFFDRVRPESVGERAAAQALTNLRADYIKAGQMTVAIENGFGGVIFHEACGHSLEATSVGIGASQMCGKLGQKIANEKVSAVDDGTIPNAWGSQNIDDEGMPMTRNLLIENGILKSYMVDRLGERRMHMPRTGCGRRESYAYEPTSRMTNTFILNGPDKNEDIIKSIEYGLYCRSMGGGSVEPLTGAFNFAVAEGYIVRNGEICEPVRGASLIGTGSQILQDIDMVGQNLERAQGMCGSSSGSIPTDVGQPLIRVAKITVGGR